MKAVIQRVNNASVRIDNQIISSIGKGMFVLLGIAETDTHKDIEIMVDKIKNLRMFEDENSKMNISIKENTGKILVVSQFTLLADLKKGRRPSFANAAQPKKAEEFYNQVVVSLKNEGLKVETGKFKENMQIESANDGPVTFIFDTNKKSL